MTLPKKGARSLQIEGETYRYKVTGNDMVIDVFIEQEGAQGQNITAQFDYHNELKGMGMKPQERIITPSTIRALVLHGLSVGWNPTAKGKADIRLDGEKIVPI